LSSRATFGFFCVHYLDNFTKRYWSTDIQDPIGLKAGAKRSSDTPRICWLVFKSTHWRPAFCSKIIFNDEAHFWLNGYVNKQNCRIWSDKQPEHVLDTPLHPKKVTVWCSLFASGIIGPYFFKNEVGENVTVNRSRYRNMISEWFLPKVLSENMEQYWFQQDDATAHTEAQSRDLLKSMFNRRLITKFDPVKLPPRSCDLTPLDYFLWGYVKSLVYVDRPTTLDALEVNMLSMRLSQSYSRKWPKIGPIVWPLLKIVEPVICTKLFLNNKCIVVFHKLNHVFGHFIHFYVIYLYLKSGCSKKHHIHYNHWVQKVNLLFIHKIERIMYYY